MTEFKKVISDMRISIQDLQCNITYKSKYIEECKQRISNNKKDISHYELAAKNNSSLIEWANQKIELKKRGIEANKRIIDDTLNEIERMKATINEYKQAIEVLMRQ